MAIAQRVAKYWVEEADLQIPGERVPGRSATNHATPLVDGTEYFGALRAEVDAFKLPGSPSRFFYFTNWILWLVAYTARPEVGGTPSAWDQQINIAPFHLDDSSGGTFPPFLDELEAMAAADVDVRSLAWVSPFVLKNEDVARRSGFYNNNAGTALSVQAIRDRLGADGYACLNMLAHPLGAFHLKMVVCGDDTNARAYISGIDFESGRVTTRTHPATHPTPLAPNWWPDAGCKVEGQAVDVAYRYFQLLWNEQIGRDEETFRIGDQRIKSHSRDAPLVPDRTFLPVPGGKHWVQVLRTAPQFHLAFGPLIGDRNAPVPVGCFSRLVVGFSRPRLSFAEDGIFEFRAAIRKAILAATNYIYVEDQAFSSLEMFDWIREAMIAAPNLKVIFVHGQDPGDPRLLAEVRNMAVNEHLAAAPQPPSLSDRVAFAFRTGGIITHTKTWIIDDEYAVIGSANAMRRSLYMDGEISVGVLDEDEPPNCFAVDYRASLWAEHCGVVPPANVSAFKDLNAALGIWNPAWGVGARPGRLQHFEVKRVPFTAGPGADEFPGGVPLPRTPEERQRLVQFADQKDGDSRQEF